MRRLLPAALLTLPPIAYYISIQSTIANNRQYLSNRQYLQIKQKQLQQNRQIKQTLKSGDHLLMKTDYRNTLTIRQYLYGLWYSFFDQWDTAGFVYQNKFDTYVLYNQFGQQKVRKFDQLTCMPWLVGLVCQENLRKNVDFGRKLGEIVEKNEGTVEVQPIRQKPLRFINRTNYNLYGENFQSILLLQHILSERAPTPKLIPTLQQRYQIQLQKMMQQMESKK